ncbi:hypothetical protein [Nocardia sp. NPDC052566]|uniref:hypothetical protein n=1 Tax=Nocardia sp. NPDC052566 TaxID=3364330 RepID=UPI0037C9B6AE
MQANSRPTGPTARFLLPAALGFCAALILVGLIALADTWGPPHREGSAPIQQPTSIAYADGRTHYVALVRTRTWLFRRDDTYSLYSGSDPGLSYGHFVDIRITGEDHPSLESADWQPEGVRLHLTSGHELFIPAKEFTFGR